MINDPHSLIPSLAFTLTPELNDGRREAAVREKKKYHLNVVNILAVTVPLC